MAQVPVRGPQVEVRIVSGQRLHVHRGDVLQGHLVIGERIVAGLNRSVEHLGAGVEVPRRVRSDARELAVWQLRCRRQQAEFLADMRSEGGAGLPPLLRGERYLASQSAG